MTHCLQDRTAEVFSTCDTRSTGSVNRNVLLLTLRQMARRTTCTCPPKYIFDQVFDDVSKLGSFEGIGQPSDVQLLEMQSALLRAPAMCVHDSTRPSLHKTQALVIRPGFF
eukprot:scaffold87561_cov30-Tisochrysis_lutea.AAC.3